MRITAVARQIGVGLLTLPALFSTSIKAQIPEARTTGRAIQVVTFFVPGGTYDAAMRIVTGRVATELGAEVTVDNRPGEDEPRVTASLVGAAGNGVTLLAVTVGHATMAALSPKSVTYNIEYDFRPVAMLGGSPIVGIVARSSGFRDIAAVLARMQAGALRVGHAGIVTPPHFALSLLGRLAPGRIEEVEFRGATTDLVAALNAGKIDFAFAPLFRVLPAIREGTVRPLVITVSRRHPGIPEVPTSAEVGLPSLAVQSWLAIMAASTTPTAVAEELGLAFVKVVSQRAVADELAAAGFLADPMGPADFAAYLTKEIDRWASTYGTERQLAESRAAANGADRQVLVEHRVALRQAVEARLAKGEKPPSKGHHPDDPIMQCSGVQPVPFVFSADATPGAGAEMAAVLAVAEGTSSFVCANSEEGARVLAYREWYCNGKDAACVLAAWSNGEPTFRTPPQHEVSFDISVSAPGSDTPAVNVKMTLSPVYK